MPPALLGRTMTSWRGARTWWYLILPNVMVSLLACWPPADMIHASGFLYPLFSVCSAGHLDNLVDTRNAHRRWKGLRWAVRMTEGWAFRICSAEAITVSYVEFTVTDQCGYYYVFSSLNWSNNMVKEGLSWACRTNRDVIFCWHTKFESRMLQDVKDLGVE
jgi:hypothetical protein